MSITPGLANDDVISFLHIPTYLIHTYMVPEPDCLLPIGAGEVIDEPRSCSGLRSQKRPPHSSHVQNPARSVAAASLEKKSGRLSPSYLYKLTNQIALELEIIYLRCAVKIIHAFRIMVYRQYLVLLPV